MDEIQDPQVEVSDASQDMYISYTPLLIFNLYSVH